MFRTAARSSSTLAAAVVAILAMTALTAHGVAGDGSNDPPPKIAFVAHGFNPADALAAGPIVAQVGGVLCTTSPNGLSEGTAACLAESEPDTVVIVGGSAALPDALEGQIAEATGLAADRIVRAAGLDRFKTAQELGTLLEDLGLNVAFLPVDGKAASAAQADHATTADDADTLDGMDSSRFGTSPVTATHGPSSAWLAYGSNVDAFRDTTALRVVAADGDFKGISIDLDRPADVGGPHDCTTDNSGPLPLQSCTYDAVELLGASICYAVESDLDEIADLTFTAVGSELGGSTNISFDGNATTEGCYAIPLGAKEPIVTRDPVVLTMNFNPDGDGGTLRVYGVRTVWGPGTVESVLGL